MISLIEIFAILFHMKMGLGRTQKLILNGSIIIYIQIYIVIFRRCENIKSIREIRSIFFYR